MAERNGYSIEDMINAKQLPKGAKLQEPKLEQLMDKLRMQRRGKNILEDEIKDLKSDSDKLQKELKELQTEAYQLERTYKEKEELCRKLQFQCEESEQESDRQKKQSEACEERLDQYRCEIQEVKLKHRKLRMKFDNQLQQMIEQHKQLHSVFTLERLPTELENAEKTISQLLSAEKMKLVQLHKLDEEVQEKKKLLKDKAAGDSSCID